MNLIQLGTVKEIATVSATTTETIITIPNIENVKLFIFVARANGTARGSLIIPRDCFTVGNDCYIICPTGDTVSRMMFNRVSNTEIKIITSNSALNRLTIYSVL